MAQGQEKVTLSGTATHEKIDHILINEPLLFYTQEPKNLLTCYKQNNLFKSAFSISKPQFIYLSIMLRNWQVYVMPGDTIRFTIDGAGLDAKIKFFGKHAANYQVFAKITDFTGGPERPPRYLISKELRHNKNNLLNYKITLDQWYKDKNEQLESLLKLYPISKSLTHIARNKIGYYYANSLYSLVSDMAADSVPKKYLNDLKKIGFNDDPLLTANEYKYAVYNRYVRFKETEGRVNLKEIEKKIKSELKGKSKDYAIASLIGACAQRKIPIDDDALFSVIRSAYTEVKDPRYLAYIRESELNYLLLNKPLTDKVLDGTLLTTYSNGMKRSLRQVLAGYPGKAVYVDLWASWCAACRVDIAESAEGKKWMTENGVAVVYFSLDKDKAAWKKATVNDKIENDQYLVENEFSSELSKFMGITSIPRYLLIDKNHFVKSIFAPRPLESDLTQLKSLVKIF
ncbi:TlpA disulfide reductase family protein [Pedobacter sp. V48]|uniref:TlpA family protein disulfide reductase n=1 Tax=Pedobacter sp. V48 TaxID=509635 RepID=UPI0003E4F438|nr:TlpA disulfide reductase family protein [Pedobacter sp. V48]ETZ21774.1 hypothetical protein N824_26420 [Pedobacter sp. V48]